MKLYYVYILANDKNGTIYVGVTNDLMRRVEEHKQKVVVGFTEKYGLNKLVYYEESDTIEAAIAREKQLKNWRRDWKLSLIERANPNWSDLALDFLDSGSSPE